MLVAHARSMRLRRSWNPIARRDLALRRVESDVTILHYSTVVSSSDVSAQVAQTRSTLLVQES